jgi:KaiC/GvpD/RAD55 family RecA-like ATPase
MANGWGQQQVGTRLCSKCQSPLSYIEQYNQWYCYNCSTYEGVSTTDADVQPQRTLLACPTCGELLYFIKKYNQHFCYRCNVYSSAEPAPTEPAPLLPPPVTPTVAAVLPPTLPVIPTADAPLKCPECGDPVEQGWIRCPGCGNALETSDIPERLVVSPDEKPKDFHSVKSTVGQKDLETMAAPHMVNKDKPPKPWEARHGGEYTWEPMAMRESESRNARSDDQSYNWKASATEQNQVRDAVAEEERVEREKAAKDESMSARKGARQETDAWSAKAKTETAVRETQSQAVRKAWEAPNEPTKAEVRGPDGEIPDGHAVRLDSEMEFLVDLFNGLIGAFLKEPMQPVSFYRSKLRVLVEKCDSLLKINVHEDGKVQIFIRSLDFNKVLTELNSVLDSIIDTEAKISSRAQAMARARESMEPIIREYQEELDDLGISTKLLNRAFAAKLPSGIPGFDEMLHGGIPNGASIILQGPATGEKDVLANQFLGCGLNENGAIMVVITMISPDEWRTQMRGLGYKLSDYEKDGSLVLVDWYTHKNERVRSVEVRGPVVLSSKSITNLEIAIDKAIKTIKDAPTKRAVIAILSPAIKALGFDTIYGFAQSIRGKFKKYNITGLFLLDKGMHDQNVMTSLQSVFDGVFDIERERIGDSMISKIGILSLKGMTFETSYKALDFTREGLAIKDVQAPPMPVGKITKY